MDKLIICECHKHLLQGHTWWVKDGYAMTSTWNSKTRKSKGIRLHRLVAGTPAGMETDHINHNRLDNRCSNLRVVTHQENMANSIKHKDNQSGFLGVSYHPKTKKWRAKIANIHIGLFETPELAAKAYEVRRGR